MLRQKWWLVVRKLENDRKEVAFLCSACGIVVGSNYINRAWAEYDDYNDHGFRN